jgi:hypothetical protein
MVWLVLMTLYAYNNEPKTIAPVTSTSTSKVLHVGTFSSMAECQAAAAAAVMIKGNGAAPGYSFLCVNSGNLTD